MLVTRGWTESPCQGRADSRMIRLRWERFQPDEHQLETGGSPENRQPLVLVNGLGSPMVRYRIGLVEQFVNRGFDVVRFDNRDAGQSSSTDGRYGLCDMARDIASIMDTMGWPTAHVLGMSMGGMIVQQFGVDFGPRARSITSIMSRTGHPDYGIPDEAVWEVLRQPSPVDRDGWLDHWVRTEVFWASPEYWDPQQARVIGAEMFDYGVQPEGSQRQLAALVQEGNREEALSKVVVPTLVLHGSADTLIPPSGGRRTAEVIPNARFVELAGMGHDLPPAYWPRIAELVADHAAASLGESRPSD